MLEDFKHALYRHKRLFWLVMVIVILSKVATIMPAIIIGRVVDTFTQHTLDSETALYLLGFICVGVINVILIPIQGYYLTRFIQKGLSDVSIRWVREIFTKHFDLFSSINIGKMLKSIERGIQASERILNYALITILPLCIEFIVISAWLVWIANIVFLALVLALSGVYLALTHYLITCVNGQLN
jgi:ABC-type bacteriocin/lantibiotic exporter with double-glycine peptidase domain